MICVEEQRYLYDKEEMYLLRVVVITYPDLEEGDEAVCGSDRRALCICDTKALAYPIEGPRS